MPQKITMTDYLHFKNLHYQNEPLLLGNVWDVQSAKVLEKLNFQALGTSSAAIAHSLGYQDGEKMPFEDMFFIIKNIVKNTTLPLSVDLEGGYGQNACEIVQNIQKLHHLGVVGINIEDSFVENSIRKLKDKNLFFSLLHEIISELKMKKISVFINVRIDTFLLDVPNAFEQTIERIKHYEKAFIDGFFVPYLTDTEDIKLIVKETNLPINLMCMPNLPNFETLKKIGVKRISMGNFMNEFLYQTMEKSIIEIQREQSFSSIFK